MLPRPRSYLIADHSTLWGSLSASFTDIPMRHEHQMFIGLIPLILLLAGTLIAIRMRTASSLAVLGGGLLVVVFSLYLEGSSLWFFIHDFPLVSAIRAVTRVDQTLLIVVAYGAGLAVNRIVSSGDRYSIVRLVSRVLIGLLVVFEAATGKIGVSEKSEWRQRADALVAITPENLPRDAVLFFAQVEPGGVASELDAMWASLRAGRPTLNGYSGQLPPGWDREFGMDCREMPFRILHYENWASENGTVAYSYEDFISRIVPIGFENCEEMWGERAPLMLRDAPHSLEEFSELSLDVSGHYRDSDSLIVEVTIRNSGQNPIRPRSFGVESIKLSWAQEPGLNFNSRVSLWEDILPESDIQQIVRVPLDALDDDWSLVISIVQEGVFWGHDVGVEVVVIDDW